MFLSKHIIRWLTLCALFWIPLLAAPASNYTVSYKMHCLYLYKFTQLIKWPEAKKSPGFVIGVMGVSPLIPELEQYLNAKNKTSAVQYRVQRLTSADAAGNCNLLYVTKEELQNFPAVVKKLTGKSVLLVSEVPGLIKKGTCINFLFEEGSSIKVQVNKQAIEEHNLKITDELLSLSTEVY